MPTPELPLVALLRAPGGETWEHPAVRIREIRTSRELDLGASYEPLRVAVASGRPVAVTSPRAARWIASAPSDIPRASIVCSGGRTARLLESGGWIAQVPAEGSGGASAARRILSSTLGGTAGPVLYVHGRETAGTFEEAMAAAGRAFESFPVYALEDRSEFDPGEIGALDGCDAIAFLAPSCARVLASAAPVHFIRLRDGRPALAGPTTAAALRVLGWRDVREAVEPSCSLLVPLLFEPNRSPERLP